MKNKNGLCGVINKNGSVFGSITTEPFDYDKALLDAQKELDELYPDYNNEELEELKKQCKELESLKELYGVPDYEPEEIKLFLLFLCFLTLCFIAFSIVVFYTL